MHKTTIIKAEYKDFFNSTDYLSVDYSDINYRVTKVTEENLPKETPNHSIVSYEKIRVDKMLGVLKYLEFKLPEVREDYNTSVYYRKTSEVIREKKSRKEWFEKNIRFFKNKLSYLDDSTTFITSKYAFFCQHFEKIKYKDEEKVVGRLYNSGSIQTLPREIRYHLFKNDYQDYDMVNSHPSILFEFSKAENLKMNGSLSLYVNEKTKVFEKIRQEQRENNFPIMSTDEIKIEVLKGINKEKYTKENDSKTLKNLILEFKIIRDHLYYLFKQGKLDEGYKDAVEKSVKRGAFSVKVSLQAFYCQTQESYHIIRLVKFLRKKYKENLEIKKQTKFTDLYPNTDKKVEISAEHTLFVIPFFDGVYVSSPDHGFNRNLNTLMQEFNNSTKGSTIAFEKKEIKKRVKHVVDEEELHNFLVLNRWLSRNSSKNLLNKYLKHSELTEKLLNGLSSMDSKELYLTELDEEEKLKKNKEWEMHYMRLVRDLKAELFKDLLSKNLKTELEIEDFIQSLSSKQ